MENTVKLVVCAGAGVFSLAHLLAAGVQVFRGPRLSHIAMSLGAVGLLCAILACFLGWRLDWLAALASCGLICGAAVQTEVRPEAFIFLTTSPGPLLRCCWFWAFFAYKERALCFHDTKKAI